jgi:hypothetical protein
MPPNSPQERTPADIADRGATFIEILVSVVLLSTAGIAILAATTTAIIGARKSDEISKSQAVIAEAADYLTDTDPDPVAYRDCDSFAVVPEYQGDLDTRFGAGVVDVVDVLFWDRNVGDFVSGTTNCRYSNGDRLQEVILRSAINESARTVAVIKRPIDVPTIDIGPADTPPAYAGGSGQATVDLNPGING